MDTMLLEYKLNVYKITKRQLKNAMGWSEGTRQARCIRGENWLVSEVKKLLDLGFSWDDLRVIFFTLKRCDYEHCGNDRAPGAQRIDGPNQRTERNREGGRG